MATKSKNPGATTLPKVAQCVSNQQPSKQPSTLPWLSYDPKGPHITIFSQHLRNILTITCKCFNKSFSNGQSLSYSVIMEPVLELASSLTWDDDEWLSALLRSRAGATDARSVVDARKSGSRRPSTIFLSPERGFLFEAISRKRRPEERSS